MTPKKKKWTQPLRFQAIDEISFEEKFSFRMNIRKLLWLMLAFLTLFAALIYVLFVYTPLNYLVPSWQEGYHLGKYQHIAHQMDSIQRRFEQQNHFLLDMQRMLNGEDFGLDSSETLAPNLGKSPLNNLIAPKADSLLREEMNQYPDAETEKQLSKLFLSPPVNNPLSIKAQKTKKTYAITLVIEPNAPIYSVAQGVVIQTLYTIEEGHVIIIQHAHNLISIYKKTANLLKKTGDIVESAEIIASASDEAEVIFELWEDGKAIEPEQYLYF